MAKQSDDDLDLATGEVLELVGHHDDPPEQQHGGPLSSTTTTVAKVITKTYSLVGGKTQIDFSAGRSP